MTRRLRSSGGSSTTGRSRSAAQPLAQALFAARRDARPDGGRPRDREAPRPAGGETRPARGRARDGRRRVEGSTRACSRTGPQSSSPSRVDPRRAPRREAEHSLDRGLGGERGVTPAASAHGPRNAGEPRRREQQKADELADLEQELLDEVWRSCALAGARGGRRDDLGRGRGGRHQSESAHAALGADRLGPCLPGPARRSAARLPSGSARRRPLVHRKRKLAGQLVGNVVSGLAGLLGELVDLVLPEALLDLVGRDLLVVPGSIPTRPSRRDPTTGTCRRARSGRRRTSPSASRVLSWRLLSSG